MQFHLSRGERTFKNWQILIIKRVSKYKRNTKNKAKRNLWKNQYGATIDRPAPAVHYRGGAEGITTSY